MSDSLLDVIVIGAGHAGLSISYCLKKHSLNHLVFERGRAGESWRSQRWNSFKLNTANKLNQLPGFDFKADDPDCFSSAQQSIDMVENYVARFQLPVVEDVTVLSVWPRAGLPSVYSPWQKKELRYWGNYRKYLKKT